jgi:hypothetical protein
VGREEINKSERNERRRVKPKGGEVFFFFLSDFQRAEDDVRQFDQ